MLKHVRTDAQKKTYQEADERDLQLFFDDRRINAKKLPRLKGSKSADFELSFDSIKVIVELKSRFDDNSYNKLLDYIQKELESINVGYDCSIQLDYRRRMNPLSSNKWKSIKQEFVAKIESLGKYTDLPIEFSFCLTDDIKSSKNEIEQLKYGLENNLTITVENKNGSDSLRFVSVAGSSAVYDPKWICDRIEEAASQLKMHDPNIPKGVFFINTTPHRWGYEEQLSPFFMPTCFVDLASNNKDIIVNRIEQENILRSDNLRIISFYGFLYRTGGEITRIDLFINCHADIQLRSDIIRKFKSYAHWITPRNRQKISLVIREL